MAPNKLKMKDRNPQERRFGVILDDIDSKFDRVLESHSATDKKIEDFKHDTRDQLKFLHFAVDNLSKGQKDIIVRFDRLEDKYDKNFDQILKYLSRIDEEIQDLKKRLNRKADLGRLFLVEQKVAEIQLVIKKIYEEGKDSN